MDIQFNKIENEKSRTYYFLGENYTQAVKIKNVIGLNVSKSGTHRINTSDGIKYIVPAGWKVIEIDADNWSL